MRTMVRSVILRYPSDAPQLRPKNQPPGNLTSNLNFVPGQIVPNMVMVKLNGGGISLFTDKGCPNVVVDVAGYFEGGGTPGAGGFVGIAPTR